MGCSIRISTHDLTRRSTNSEIVDQGQVLISTHDLTRRSTSSFSTISTFCDNIFQLTTSQGGRPISVEVFANVLPISTHDLTRRSTSARHLYHLLRTGFQLTTSQGGRQQFLRKKFSFQNHFLCSLHIIYSYYINIVFFSTLFLAKSSFFLVRIP